MPTEDNILIYASDSDAIEELYLQNISPTEQGTYQVDNGEIVWGYWKSGAQVPDSVDDSLILEESIVFIVASDEISDSLSESLSESTIRALRDQLETGVTFNWVDGTGLVPSDGGDIIPILPNSSIVLSNREGVQVEILLDGFGKLIGSSHDDEFSLDGISLVPEGCGARNCFEQGEFNGRYIGEEAATIMSLIEAWGDETGDYIGTGVFVRPAPTP
ncbi:hypothetical protein ELY40_10595 [Vreelandella populi]|nr:hypothetical protein ELY40_10595 [Halomonas populi]